MSFRPPCYAVTGLVARSRVSTRLASNLAIGIAAFAAPGLPPRDGQVNHWTLPSGSLCGLRHIASPLVLRSRSVFAPSEGLSTFCGAGLVLAPDRRNSLISGHPPPARAGGDDSICEDNRMRRVYFRAAVYLPKALFAGRRLRRFA